MERKSSNGFSVSPIFFVYLCSSSFCMLCCNANDTITREEGIRDWETIVSAGKKFVLGFFTPENTRNPNRYVGIWYYVTKTIVWVANRENAVTDASGELFIGNDGNLALNDRKGNVVWSTNIATAASNPTATLLDSGNLVLRDSEKTIWQSFDFPSDTLLPGMKVGINLKTNGTQKLTSWKNAQDPTYGRFSFGVDVNYGQNQFFMLSNKSGKSVAYWSSGNSVSPLIDMNPTFNSRVVSNADEFFVSFSSFYNETRVMMDLSGQLKGFVWYDAAEQWLLVWSEPENFCGVYAVCGVYSTCDSNTVPACKCLTGFTPLSPDEWDGGDFSGGCTRRAQLNCEGDGFLLIKGMKVGNPDKLYGVESVGSEEKCREECLGDCSCIAFANGYTNSTNRLRCLIWSQDLINLPDDGYNISDGWFINLRLATSELMTSEIRCNDCNNTVIPYPLSTGPNCGDPAYQSFTCDNSTGNLHFNALNTSYTVTNIDSKTRTFVLQLDQMSNCMEGISKRSYLQIDSKAPFYITTRNTIFLINCSSHPVSTDCSSSSRCYRFIQEKPLKRNNEHKKQHCFDSVTCCSYDAGGSPFTTHSIGDFSKMCKGYTSIVDVNLLSDASSWLEGIEIGWNPPLEPICHSLKDCDHFPDSTCRSAAVGDGQRRCMCKESFQWNPSMENCTTVIGIGAFDDSKREKKPSSMIISITVVIAALLLGIFIYCSWRIIKRKDREKRLKMALYRLGASDPNSNDTMDTNELGKDGEEGIDLPFFEFETVVNATENFSDAKKLGQGGFGPVYKGKLPGGQEIAVKRLSKYSGQGVQEFKNEVTLIAKLQHRNLVRLLGFCIQGDEKMLLYEYMPNKSLDYFLFDPTRCLILDWDKRFNIILGIARGLLYLHQDSRLRIIHRDLKTSNILLDEAMNPKISDFGMARIFGGDQTQANTNRVVGTYGYMSPEYALGGLFSMKSDVYSFGVILLEIISGKKNTGFYHSQESFTLLGHAWKLWKEDKGLDLIDPSLGEANNECQLLMCLHVGLLCVQEDATDRPTMTSIMVMLSGEMLNLPTPKQPAFLIRKSLPNAESLSRKPETCSRNEITISSIGGR